MSQMFYQKSPDMERRKKLAYSMMQQGMDGSPVGHWTQALGRMANTYVGKKNLDKIENEETQKRNDLYQKMATVLGGNPLSEATDGAELPQTDKRNALVQALMSDPSTADYGMQMGMQLAMEKPTERKRERAKDARGRMRYVDDGSFVYPDMENYDPDVLSDAALNQKRSIAESGRTTVNNNVGQSMPVPEYNKLPAGFVYKRGSDGQILIDEDGSPIAIPIKGGPEAIKAQKEAEAKAKREKLDARNAGIVVEDINRSIDIIDNDGLVGSTGLQGMLWKGIPGTDAHALDKMILTVKANAGFDRLQQMRDASPTGGALGQVSELELKTLQSAIGNLEQSQDAETLKYNLERVKTIYQDIVHGPNTGEGTSEGKKDNDPLGIR